ncbi:MAG: hypothetical protein WC050_04870 [Candidatus Paceibacterota bacterium]
MMQFSCAECGEDAGTSLVCRNCIPLLSDYKRDKYMRVWHKIIVERDGNECVYCGHSATWDSGELCGNHNPTKGSAPDKIFDVTLHECTCMTCNGKHSYTASREAKQPVPKVKKLPTCDFPGCPISAILTGKKPKRCWKHQ